MKLKHNCFYFSFGNEDRMESAELYFSTPQECAYFLRELANNITTFKSSKDYRSSDRSIFDGMNEEYLNKLGNMSED